MKRLLITNVPLISHSFSHQRQCKEPLLRNKNPLLVGLLHKMSLIPSVKFSVDIPTHVPKLLDHITDNLKQNQLEIALILSKIVHEELENVLESDSYYVGWILSVIALITAKMNQYDKTENLLEKAIFILDKSRGESNFAVNVIWMLVEEFYGNCQHEEAEFFGKIVTGFYGKLHEIDTSKLADLNDMVGKSCLELKKPDEAKEFFQAALSFYSKKIDICTVEVTKILKSLEIVYFWRNNIAESKELFENSNEIANVNPLCSLGMLCEDANLPSKAVDYYQRAVKIYESKGSPDDSQLADISLKLGKCYLKIGEYLESQIYLEKSCAIYKKTLADDDPVMLDIKIHLALCCVKTARFDEAERIYEEILGNVHTDGSDVPILDWVRDNEKSKVVKIPILNGKYNAIVSVLMNLGALYVLDGKYKAAKILQSFGESQRDRIEHDGN